MLHVLIFEEKLLDNALPIENKRGIHKIFKYNDIGYSEWRALAYCFCNVFILFEHLKRRSHNSVTEIKSWIFNETFT